MLEHGPVEAPLQVLGHLGVFTALPVVFATIPEHGLHVTDKLLLGAV